MKIHTLTIKALKNVLEASLEFDPHMNVVSGQNGAGKSTIIDAIFLAILGKSYIGKGKSIESLITEGEHESEINIELSGEKTVKIVRKIDSDGEVSLAIWASDASKLLQIDLNNLLSEFTIDPLEFTRKGPKEQYDTIKTLAGSKVLELEEEIRKVFDNRKILKAVAEKDLALAESLKDVEETQEVNSQELLTEYSQALVINRGNDEINQKRASKIARKAEIEKELIEIASYLALNPEDKKLINTEEIQKKIGGAEEINKKAALYQQKIKAIKEADTSEASHQNANKALEELREKRKQMITDSIDIKGIDFNERDGVVLEGRPLSTYSTAEQIITACRIATFSNPLLKVISIKDGSLLDETNMKKLREFAAANDYQIFIERVGEEYDSIVLRNGEVVEQKKEEKALPKAKKERK